MKSKRDSEGAGAGAAVAEERPEAPRPGAGWGSRELSTWVRRGLLGAVFALSFVFFWPALGQGFVDWDDDRLFVNNPYWRGLSSENVRWMFASWHQLGSFYMGHYQPFTWVSFAIEYELWGVNAERMHLVNMLLHGLNAVLVCLMSVRLFAWHQGESRQHGAGLWVGASLAALLFSMHPLRVESVAWATERRDLLSMFFLLLCVLSWLAMLRSEGSRLGWWALVLLTYVLSLGSKAWGMTLPVLLVLIDVWPLRRLEQGPGATSLSGPTRAREVAAALVRHRCRLAGGPGPGHLWSHR